MKEDRLPILKWLKPGSNWMAAVLFKVLGVGQEKLERGGSSYLIVAD